VNDQDPRPRVTVFALGGTIASLHAGEARSLGGVVPELDARALVETVPQLRDVAVLEAVSFRQVPSADLVLGDLVELASEIERRLSEGAAGVVVTQGTDTLEETAFALDLLVRSDRPVVVTGAMRNPTLAGPDGPANLLAAVQVAASSQGAGLGTLVVFNDEIHAARFVRKTHSSSTAAFQSPTAGPIGWVYEGRPRVVFRVPPLQGVPDLQGVTAPPVALFTATLGDDLRLVAHVESSGYRGLVLEAFGVGHVPGRVVEALEDLASRLPVVFASRAGAGEVFRSTYGFPGSERDLLSRGLISAGFLDGPKARVLLSLLLGALHGLGEVREAFESLDASIGSSQFRHGS